MTQQEHLLTIISEECAEVAKCCSKALRFGATDREPNQSDTNRRRILLEFNDLVAAMQMYFDVPLDFLIEEEAIENKKENVKKFLLYSKEQGTLIE